MNLEYGKPFHNLTTDECRAIGRRGGLRSARNRRQHRMAEASVPRAITPEPKRESAHEASLLLDARLPHLRDAWVRTTRPAA